MTNTFKDNDIVCYKAKFLRDIGWYTNVPMNGLVQATQGDFVTVLWNDRDEARPVNRCNIILFSERHLEPA